MLEAQPGDASGAADWSPLLEMLPIGVALLSSAGAILQANPHAEAVLDGHLPQIAALADGQCSFIHDIGIRLQIRSVGANRLVMMEPVPLSESAPFALVMERSGRILRAAGALSGLVSVGDSLFDVLDEADQEDLSALLTDGGGELELMLPMGGRKRILACRIEEQPKMGGWVVIGEDRTWERKLQSALREGERRFLRLIEGIPVALLITDAGGRSAYANVRADALLGGIQLHQNTPLKSLLKASRMRTSSDSSPYPPERLPMLRALEGERCSINDVEMLQDGRWIALEISSAPVVGLDGENIFVITILQDINARRELEQRLYRVQRMEAVGQLAGELAHDFNNFLTAISSYSQLTLSALTPDHIARSDVEEVIRTAHRAAALTRQLLTISCRQPMTMRQLSLVGLLRRMGRLLERLLGEKTMLEVVQDRGIWPVMADEGLLERVIINLTVNARDALTGVSGGRLRISMENVVLDEEAAADLVDVRPGAYVVAAFEDNGVGIPSGVIDRIFEPFFTTKTDTEGTGLGLSMVYGVIRQSGGFLSVDSPPGQGTTFRIALPRAEWVAQPFEPVVGVTPSSGRILLVEDEEGVRRSTARILRNQGYTVYTVAGPLEALGLFETSHPSFDLVVSDVNLPGMRGDELVPMLLEYQLDMAVLFISGSLLEETLLGRRILTKPFTAEELGRRVARLISEAS